MLVTSVTRSVVMVVASAAMMSTTTAMSAVASEAGMDCRTVPAIPVCATSTCGHLIAYQMSF